MESKANVMLSYPVHNQANLKSILSVLDCIAKSKYCTVKPLFMQGDSFIQRVRNNAITEFVGHADYEYLCTIDSDIIIKNVSNDDNLFDILLNDDKDIVGGLYCLKNNKRICTSVDIDGKRDFEYNSGLIEMKWLASGCQFIKRKIILDMIEVYKDQEYYSDGEIIRLTYGLYNPIIFKIIQKNDNSNISLRKKLLSEDWSFIQRARDIGFRVFADTSILLQHDEFVLFPEAISK
jgi:hypothetical protein